METFRRPLTKSFTTKIFIVAVGALLLLICSVIFVWATKGLDDMRVLPSSILVNLGIILLFFNNLHYITVTEKYLTFRNSVFSSRKIELEWDNIQEIMFYHPPRWSMAYAKILLKDQQRPFTIYLDTVPPESYERFLQICREHGVPLRTPRREKWLRRHPEFQPQNNV